MPYLIEHTDACACASRAPVAYDTPAAVAHYLTGRAALRHPVWAGEYPYRFFMKNKRIITILLETCDVAHIQPYVPCALYAGTRLLLIIGQPRGTGRISQVFRPIQVDDWLAYRFHNIPLPEAVLP